MVHIVTVQFKLYAKNKDEAMQLLDFDLEESGYIFKIIKAEKSERRKSGRKVR